MSYYERSLRPDELMHFGVLGMKWGIRRYQNPDGTLTELGKRRVATGRGKVDKKTGVYLNVSRKERRRAAAIKQKRIENLNKARMKEKLAREDKLKSSQMTDKQLDERIARLKKEKEYQNLLQDTRAVKRGESYAKKKLGDVGDKLLDNVIKTGTAVVGVAIAKAIIDSQLSGKPFGASFKSYAKVGLGKTDDDKDKDKDKK